MKRNLILITLGALVSLQAGAADESRLFTLSNRGTSNSSMETGILYQADTLAGLSVSGAMAGDAISYTPTLKGANGASTRVVEGGATASSQSVAIARAKAGSGDGSFMYTLDLRFGGAATPAPVGLTSVSVDFAMLRERYTRSFGDDSHGHPGEAVHFGADITYRYSLLNADTGITLASGQSMVTTPGGVGCNPLSSITDAVDSSVYTARNADQLSVAMTGVRDVIDFDAPVTLAADTNYQFVITLDSVKVTGTQANVILNEHITDENLVRYTNYANYVALGNISAFGGALPVPEPATAGLSLLAMAGVLARRKRK